MTSQARPFDPDISMFGDEETNLDEETDLEDEASEEDESNPIDLDETFIELEDSPDSAFESDESQNDNPRIVVVGDGYDDHRIINEIKQDTAKKEVRNFLLQQVLMCTRPQDYFESEAEFYQIGPYFEFPNYRRFDNVTFHSDFGIVPVHMDDAHKITIRLGDRRTRETWMRIMIIMKKIFKNLEDKQKTTKRALYYFLLSEPGANFTYEQVDTTIEMIVAKLQIPRGDLGILGTSKGLITGNITFRMLSGGTFDCRDTGIIPNDVDDIAKIDIELHGRALVIVVEKDAVYQRLLREEFLNVVRVQSMIDGVPQIDPIIITAKGYPDLATRKLLRRLAYQDLPNADYYAFVDGDPHGYEIFTTYAYGSVAMAWCAEPLAVPKLEWIGVKPSEFEYLPDHHKRPLTVADQAKLDSINDREIFSPEHAEELAIMDNLKLKVEIEDLPEISQYLWEYFEHLVDEAVEDDDRFEE